MKVVECSDEVPRRGLITYNDMKLWVLHWSYLEFGLAALPNEYEWFTRLTIRSSIVRNKIASGMGQLDNIYNKMCFNLCDGLTSATA